MKRRKYQPNLLRIVGLGSIALLAIVALTSLFPSVSSSANAENLATGLTTQTSVYLHSTIALATSDNIAVDIVPKVGGKVEVGTANVYVSTNNTTGYSLLLSAVNPSNRLEQVDRALSFDGNNESYGINPLSVKTKYANYLDSTTNLNTWGYALTEGEADANTEYEGLTDTSSTLKTIHSTSSNDAYSLNIAVAVDTSLPAGSYRNGLIITAVANPIELRGFAEIYYMQQMTGEVCNRAATESTGELVDKRDNTIYQVAKLADGHCWMTQNLALDLSTETALTPEDTDISENWTPLSDTEGDIPFPNTESYTTARSWNFGKIILTNPTEGKSCPFRSAPTIEGITFPNSDPTYASAFTGQKITETCSDYYKDLSSGWIADSNPDLYSATSSINDNKYDPHYLIGNYYQWNAATAGTGIGLVGTNATSATGEGLTSASGSICPKGWMLPKSGKNHSATETIFDIIGPGQSYDMEDSFYGLLKNYGYNTNWNVNNGNGTLTINDKDRTADLTYKPMYFVRSGAVNPYFGIIRHAGGFGFAWSGTATSGSDRRSNNLDINKTQVFPSNSYDRYTGFPVRCLAK